MFEIGSTLREARERRQLTHDQVEGETKIRAKYVRALEDEQFEILPSGTYVKGFLRSYADFLGLEGQIFVDEYVSRFGTRHDDDLFRRRRERPQTARRESSSALVVAIVAVVALSVLVFVAWRWGPSDSPSRTLTANAPTITAAPGDLRAKNAVKTGTVATGATTVHLAIQIVGAPSYALVTSLTTGKVVRRCDPSCKAGTSISASDRNGFELAFGNLAAIKVKINGVDFVPQGQHVWATLDAEQRGQLTQTAPEPTTG